MEVINNLANTHKDKIYSLLAECDEVIIVSPFLLENFKLIFSNQENFSHLKKIKLVTTLKPNDWDQVRKIKSFNSLIKVAEEYKIDIEIFINNKLHGKIYIFKYLDFKKAIITSANFTNKGLSDNHEWGVLISDTKHVESLESEVWDCLQYDRLTKKEIEAIIEEANKYAFQEKEQEAPPIDIDLTIFLNSKNKARIEIAEHPTFWIKPFGTSQDPVHSDWIFSEIHHDLTFSKYPASVKVGNILIAYGVGDRRIVSIYKALEDPFRISQEEIEKEPWRERWPWCIRCENLSPKYGVEWSHFDLYLGNLANEFIRLNPTENLTLTRQSLGGLNYGHDKLRLNEKFARFIISKVENTFKTC